MSLLTFHISPFHRNETQFTPAPSGKVAASPPVMNPAKEKLKLFNLAYRYIWLRTYRMWSHTDGYYVRDITSQHAPAIASPGLGPTGRFPASRRRCHDVA